MSAQGVVLAYIGLGGNMDEPVGQLRSAMEELGELPASRLVRCSSLYRTEPIGVEAQPDFINAVCALETGLSAQALLDALLDIERRHGRRRNGATGQPRSLDLDLLLYGQQHLAETRLTLPHPRLHERAFVLYPLAEIAPGLIVPGHGTVESLLPACRGQRIEKLSGWAGRGGR
jgi:2-amino-4-hydroxy-6-hydroxymethyldihydropteridine diphosphokinase